jgi:hypothetical protein
VVVSDGDYDTGPDKYDYMITVETWKDLPKTLRRMVKGLIAKGNFMQAMAYKRTGMPISATVHKDFETEQAKQFTDMIKQPKGKVVAVMADKITENENGDDLGYGSQRKNIMDERLTLMWTTRKEANKIRLK